MKPKMLFSWEEVREIDREGLESAYMNLYSAYITASTDRYCRSKNIAKDLLRKERLSEQRDALLQVIDYYRGCIDFREVEYNAKRIIQTIITCLDIWNNTKLDPPIRKTSKLYAKVMKDLEVDLLSEEEQQYFLEILAEERDIERPWKEWQLKIVLAISEDLIKDEKSEIKARAYQVGRNVKQVAERMYL